MTSTYLKAKLSSRDSLLTGLSFFLFSLPLTIKFGKFSLTENLTSTNINFFAYLLEAVLKGEKIHFFYFLSHSLWIIQPCGILV